jgi:aspartyl-tRNA synthetase
VLDVLEQVVVASFEALGRTPPSRPFPRMSYADAMLRYGSDKPDLRFGLEIQDATALTRDSQFGVFANAETVRYLVAPRSFSRGELQKLEDFAKEWGAKGLAYLVYDERREVRSPIAKFLTEGELEAFRAPPGSTVPSSRTARRWSSGCSAPCVSTSARSSASSTSRGTSSTGCSTSHCS